MKIEPVSGDLVVKIAIGAAVVLGAVYLARKAGGALGGAASEAVTWAGNVAATKLNPASDQNIVYQDANSVVSAAAGRPETLGGWWYSLWHADPMAGN